MSPVLRSGMLLVAASMLWLLMSWTPSALDPRLVRTLADLAPALHLSQPSAAGATVVPPAGQPPADALVPNSQSGLHVRAGIAPYAELVAPAALVPLNAPIEITFSRPMYRQSVERSFKIQPEVAGTLRWIDERTVIFQPVRFAYQTTYQIQIFGLSTAGDPLVGPTLWSFTTEKQITITIDDCGNAVQLQAILNVLAERHLKAMMFPTGECAARFSWLVPTMVAQGHQVCNHTYSHPRLTRLTDAQIAAEIKTGVHANCDWFKPPWDDWDGRGGRVERIANSLGLRVLVYDIDTMDWTGASADEMLARISAKGGGIVSMHFHGRNTVELIRRLPPP